MDQLGRGLLLTGAQRAFERPPRSLQVSLLTSLCALPVIGLVWVIVHGLGANLALMVVGLHSVMFAYLGRDDRESPYNLVAVGGFVLFVLLTFWTKLHLRAVHAYIIPVGLGVLLLLHLLRARIEPRTRSGVRLLTLLSMLGSAGALRLPRSALSGDLQFGAHSPLPSRDGPGQLAEGAFVSGAGFRRVDRGADFALWPRC